MQSSTTNLALRADAAIDLQLHTVLSDGVWAPEALLDHAASEQFGLIAITDHDRVDTAAALQRLALERGVPLLVAAELTTTWKGGLTDVLCYGFDPGRNHLQPLADDVLRRQQENTRQVYEFLCEKGYVAPDDSGADLAALLEVPSAQQPREVVALLKQHRAGQSEPPLGQILKAAGCDFATSELAAVVDAAHRSGPVCLIAHPGRSDGFNCFDVAMLDELRRDIPIDGLEVYYPVHTPAQTAMFLEYAIAHGLLTSSGSDSHSPETPPIRYEAGLSRRLLERLGIRVG